MLYRLANTAMRLGPSKTPIHKVRSNTLPSKPKRLTARYMSSTATMSTEKLLSYRPSAKTRDVRSIEASTLLPAEEYAKARRELYYPLKRLLKKDRVLMLGPYATVTFENYDLMWLQVQEMLFVEGGEIAEELEVYNPLVPNGSNFIVTLMFEIVNPIRRDQILRELGHVEDTLSISLPGKFNVLASSVDGHDIERTSADGKTSAVHFLKFHFTDDQKQEFIRLAETNSDAFELSFSHANYAHSTKIPSKTLKEIAKDLA